MSDPPTILLWHWGRRGGGPRYTLELAKALAQRDDMRLHLSLSRQSEMFDETAALGLPGLHIDTYGKLSEFALRSARLPMLRRRFARYLKTSGVAVVLCTMHHLWNAFVAPAVRSSGSLYLLTVHDAERHPGEDARILQWLMRRDVAAADGAITLTDAVRGRLAASHGFPASRIWVAPHGVFAYSRATAARSLPVDRPLRLLFFGRILPYKGLDLLLDAYARLRAGGVAVELEIWGMGDLGPYQAQMSKLQGVTVVNRWIGEDEIGGIVERSDLCVLPYREASQSGVVASAVAAGLPIVATPVGGLSEQVEDGVIGIVATAVDADALAQAILAAISDNQSYARLSKGALEIAASEMSWGRIGDQVGNALQQLMHLGPRRR